MENKIEEVLKKEEAFHDEWANSVNIDDIDVIKMNMAITLPEVRYVHKKIGNIKGKKILDIGCGFGEVGIYFAMQGADVVASDISGGFLNVVEKIAKKNNVNIRTHKSNAENLEFEDGEQFDIVFANAIMHHVDIEKAMINIKKILKPDGMFICIEPVAYNPVINIYRKLSPDVRTEDEHPLKLKDINNIRKHFSDVKTKYFWLFSLIIFVLMAIRNNPNKVRLWKKVAEDENKWKYLYVPLKFLDDIFFTIFPFLGLLSCNVVILARNKKQ